MADSFETVTAVVPIRRGSQRIPGKNLRTFISGANGSEQSLLEWKLRQLLDVLPGANVMVSTDWDLAAELASDLGCLIHHRDVSLTGSDSPFNEVIAGVVSEVQTLHAMWCPATSPLVGPRRIRHFLEIYLGLSESDRADGLIAVSRTFSYCFMGGSPVNFSLGAGHVRTQEIEPIEVMNWALSARPTPEVLRDAYMFTESATRLLLEDWENTDVNDELDFQVAQLLLPLYRSFEDDATREGQE